MDELARSRSLGETIRVRRVALGWTQEVLAARIGGEGGICHQSEVSRLERGRVGLPRRARLERIAAALDLPLGDLLARSGWAGAEAAFHSVDVVVPSRENPPPTASPPPVTRSLEVPASRPGAGSRLHDAVTQAQALQARSTELLRASAATLGQAGHPLFRRDDLAFDPKAGGDGEATHEA